MQTLSECAGKETARVNRLSLKFSDPELEQQYRAHSMRSCIHDTKVVWSILSFIMTAVFVLMALGTSPSGWVSLSIDSPWRPFVVALSSSITAYYYSYRPEKLISMPERWYILCIVLVISTLLFNKYTMWLDRNDIDCFQVTMFSFMGELVVISLALPWQFSYFFVAFIFTVLSQLFVMREVGAFGTVGGTALVVMYYILLLFWNRSNNLKSRRSFLQQKRLDQARINVSSLLENLIL
jgi:hypothetical protein